MDSLTSIIIPSYNGLHLLEPCIESIQRYTQVPYEIIVVDNKSADRTTDYCISNKITFISLSNNVAAPVACNKGFRIAAGEQLLLINNDVITSPRWLSNLLVALHSDERVGMVGPVMTNYTNSREQIKQNYSNIKRFQRIAEKTNHSDPTKWEVTERLVGSCMLFKRSMMKEIGMLNERFSPEHNEDNDYCYRARMRGYRLLMCKDTLVHHEGSTNIIAKELA